MGLIKISRHDMSTTLPNVELYNRKIIIHRSKADKSLNRQHDIVALWKGVRLLKREN